MNRFLLAHPVAIHLVSLVAYAFLTAPANAAPPQSLGLFAVDNLDANGVQSYSLRASVLPSPTLAKSLISPSGSEFDFFASPVVAHADLGTFGTLQEMIDALPGEWTYQVASPANPMLIESYHFTIAPFNSSDLTAVRPTILQPANGAVVHGPFDVEWDPPSESFGAGATGVLFDHTLVRPGLLHVTPNFHPSLPLQTGAFQFSTSAGQSLSSYVSEVTPPNNSPFELTTTLAFSRRIEIKVVVAAVPEPTSMSLFSVAALALASRQRRHKKAPSVALQE